MDVPLEDDMRNTLYFANASAQQTYFQSKIAKSYVNVSYQSDTRTFRCPDQLDTVRQYNYIMWQNPAYSSKWFYAFIKKSTYVNDKFTDVEFEVDPLQTFMFDITVKASFVEREHCNDDTVGKHTLPENFDLGEYQINKTTHYSIVSDDPDGDVATGHDKWYVCFCVTEPPEPNNPVPIVPVTGYDIGGVFTPLIFFAVKSTNAYDDCMDIINWYKRTHETVDTAIVNMYMIPDSCVDLTVSQTWTDSGASKTFTVYAVKSNADFAQHGGDAFLETQYLSGLYTPRNKKLLTYPYTYLYLDNKCGEAVTYHWEDGEDVNTGTTQNPVYVKGYKFKTAIVPSASLSAKLFPTTYKGKTETSGYYGLWNYGINYAKAPVCAWVNDYYTNWLTQNGVNTAVNVGLGIAGTALGIATGGLGLIAGGLNLAHTVGNTVAEMTRADKTPPQAQGDINTGDVTYAYTFNNITAYEMTIKKEVAEVIDSYFDMFGYKCNRVKVPNVNHRQNWWYTKTIGANITGNVPNDELNKIKKAYDDGITYWKDPTKYLDYSQSNGIV